MLDVHKRHHLQRMILAEYAKKGEVVKLGWMAFHTVVCQQQNLNEETTQLCRDAFYMGIQHIYAALMSNDKDPEDPANQVETNTDIRILESIHNEVDVFLQEFLPRQKTVAEQMMKMETPPKS
jgi:hypothetical protein